MENREDMIKRWEKEIEIDKKLLKKYKDNPKIASVIEGSIRLKEGAIKETKENK